MYISAHTPSLTSSAQCLFLFCGLGFSSDRSFAAYSLIARGGLCPENDVLKMLRKPALHVPIHPHLPHSVSHQIDAHSRRGGAALL